MTKATTQVSGIKKTINHPQWFVPMSYHKLTRVEHSLITNETVATFASYYSKEAHDAGAKQLDYTSIILPLATSDFSDVINAVKSGDNDLADGEAV